MRHLVLGAGGQLGYAFVRSLQGEVLALGRDEADLRFLDGWVDRAASFRPEVVVNCAAYNQVDRAESDPQGAWEVNALAVRRLAAWCAASQCILVHFSTNYVFGLEENRRRPYREEDAPGPVSVYGTSKLAGEYFAAAECPRSIVVRTCGLFGPRPPGKPDANFPATMVRLAQQGRIPKVVEDQVCTPTHVDDVVRGTLALVERECYGLHHLTASGECSWYEFADAVLRGIGKPGGVEPIDSVVHGAAARRPAYSVLDCARVALQAGFRARTWKEGLEDYLAFRREEWRP